jgi:nicotinamide riboside kinase
MIEHERSYVFTHEGAYEFLKSQGCLDEELGSSINIEDSYLGRGMRVRKSWTDPDGISYIYTRKTGDKSKGYRFEFEEKISEKLAEQLTATPDMVVKKTRRTLHIPRAVSSDAEHHYVVTMDFIEEPMKLAVLEIEALNEIVFPIPADIAYKLFGVQLQECPLCTYRLFNRHIGIAGGPSSGKSETAKIVSHTLNTEMGANSFHVAEFATTFIQKYKKNPNFWEEFFIWHGQHEREHSADAANIVISDCPTFLTYIYLLHLPKDAFSASTAMVLAKMYKRVLFDIEWYSDLILLEIQEYKENAIRYQSFEEALEIQARIRGFLVDHNISFTTYDYTQKDKMLKDLFYINA